MEGYITVRDLRRVQTIKRPVIHLYLNPTMRAIIGVTIDPRDTHLLHCNEVRNVFTMEAGTIRVTAYVNMELARTYAKCMEENKYSRIQFNRFRDSLTQIGQVRTHIDLRTAKILDFDRRNDRFTAEINICQ